MNNHSLISYQHLSKNINSFFDASHSFEKGALRVCEEHEVPLVVLINYQVRAVAVGYCNSSVIGHDEEKLVVAQFVPPRLLQLMKLDIDQFDSIFQKEICMRISTCQQILQSCVFVSDETKAHIRHLLTTQTIFTADLKVND